MRPSTTTARCLASAGALAALAAVAAPSSALAAGSPFTCEASALSVSLLGTAPVEPLVTNRGAPACVNTSLGIGNLTQPLPPLFGASALDAATFATGANDKQQALAAGGLADAAIGSLSSLGLSLPLDSIQLPAQLQSVPLDISPITGPLNAALGTVTGTVGTVGGTVGGVAGTIGGVAGVPIVGTGTTGVTGGLTLPSTINIDIADAVKQLLKLPTADVLSARSAVALASGTCASGSPVLDSTRSVADVSVLGQSINLDDPNNQDILNTQSIDLSQLDASQIKLPAIDGLTGGALASVQAQIVPLLQSALNSLGKVSLPISLGEVRVAPGVQTRTASSIEQTGPEILINLVGQSIADLKLGDAKVGSAGVDCTAPATAPAVAPVTAADTELACTKRKLTLVDVVPTGGNQVKLTGAADKKFVGQFVTIKFLADGSIAGRALVKPDGSFATTAPMPSHKLAISNLARYEANIGSEKSLDLKLARRMTVTKLVSSNGKVTIAGAISRPLSTPAQTIELRRRVSCKKSVVVARFKPHADGTYSITVDAPAGVSATVYRLATRVRKNTTNKKTFPTFTLPRGVDLDK